jgi:hypothetical protein
MLMTKSIMAVSNENALKKLENNPQISVVVTGKNSSSTTLSFVLENVTISRYSIALIL